MSSILQNCLYVKKKTTVILQCLQFVHNLQVGKIKQPEMQIIYTIVVFNSSSFLRL